MEILTATLVSLLSRVPIFLVWLVGFVMAVARWRRHPKVSALVVVAIAVFASLSVATTLLYTWLPLYSNRSGVELGWIFGIAGLVSSFIYSVAWALILAAVFMWRSVSLPEPENAVDGKLDPTFTMPLDSENPYRPPRTEDGD